jgi:hypothetical protein
MSNTVYDKKDLDDLFMPGEPNTLRRANRFKRGYLKKSIFSNGWISTNTPHQGEKERKRRLKQLNKTNEIN